MRLQSVHGTQALEIAEFLEAKDQFARILLNISRVLYVAGLYSFSLTYWEKLRSFEQILEAPVFHMTEYCGRLE